MKELQEKGQIYDFRNDTDMAEEIAVELESMNPKELNGLKTEMHHVLTESRKEQENNFVLPGLPTVFEKGINNDLDRENLSLTRKIRDYEEKAGKKPGTIIPIV